MLTKGTIVDIKLHKRNEVTKVIQVLRAGLDFYQDSIVRVEDSNTQQIFADIIKQRQLAINELRTLTVNKTSQVQEGEELAGSTDDSYNSLRKVVRFDKLTGFADQLRAIENKTLSVIDEAIRIPQPQVYKQYLQRVRVSMQACLDKFKFL